MRLRRSPNPSLKSSTPIIKFHPNCTSMRGPIFDSKVFAGTVLAGFVALGLFAAPARAQINPTPSCSTMLQGTAEETASSLTPSSPIASTTTSPRLCSPATPRTSPSRTPRSCSTRLLQPHVHPQPGVEPARHGIFHGPRLQSRQCSRWAGITGWVAGSDSDPTLTVDLGASVTLPACLAQAERSGCHQSDYSPDLAGRRDLHRSTRRNLSSWSY
jgi:hypothetical protein